MITEGVTSSFFQNLEEKKIELLPLGLYPRKALIYMSICYLLQKGLRHALRNDIRFLLPNFHEIKINIV